MLEAIVNNYLAWGLEISKCEKCKTTLSTIAFGVNAGWCSPYLPYLLSNSTTIPTTPFAANWCATSALLGCLNGAVIAAYLVDRIGRKRSMLMLAPVTYLGFIGMAFANSIWHLTALRFLIGVTDGAMYTVLPMYIGEIVDPDIRGFLSSTLCIFLIIGILLINTIGPVTTIFTSSVLVSLIPAMHFILVLFIPESPYYYVKSKKYGLAKDSLRILRRESRICSDLESLKSFVTNEREMVKNSSFLNLFIIPTNRKGCIICFLLIFANKMSGKTAITVFTSTIFSESGSNINATLSTIIYTIVELIIIFVVTFFIIDRFGKRLLMIISCSGSSLSILLLATYFYLKDSGSSIISSFNWFPITSLISYNIIFSIGLNFGGSTYLSELFPMNVKANASCLAEISGVVLGLISLNFFQITYLHVGMYFPLLSFAIICGFTAILIYKIVPETRGKSLAEIQDLLIGCCEKIDAPHA